MRHILSTIMSVILIGCGNPKSDIALINAAKRGNIEAVKSALADGADMNANDADGWTALHQSAFYGPKEVVELLITRGANLNAKEKDGWTPLDQAAYGGNKEIAELLITKGADVNTKNNREMTPLHHASIKGHKEVVELLILRGADVNAKVAFGSKRGLTSLDAANEIKNPEISGLLRKHGGKTGLELKAEEK